MVRGLKDESRRPKSSPFKKVLPVHEKRIADLRKRKLGHRRIQNELRCLHDISLSTATIHKVLERIGKPILHHKRAYRKQVIRYIHFDRPDGRVERLDLLEGGVEAVAQDHDQLQD
jgi:hypothetical protein